MMKGCLPLLSLLLLVCLGGALLAERKRSLMSDLFDLFSEAPTSEEVANQAQLEEILAAFKPIVAQASASTVWVTSESKRVALGTIVSADGLILTKASEVGGGDLRCFFGDGSSEAAVIERTLPKHDVAFLRVDREGMIPAELVPDAPVVGSLIATPGTGGEVAGVGVVSVATRDLSGQGKGYLGIAVGQFDQGLVIRGVTEGSAAEAAGLRVGDVLVRVDENRFDDVRAFVDHVSKIPPGREVRLAILRGKRERDITAVLGSRAEASELFNPLNPMDLMGGATSRHRTGYPEAWQHDIGLAPFRMGGPVVDLDGRVIGINIARSGRTKTYALPASLVLGWLEDSGSGEEDLGQLLKELRAAEQELKAAREALEAIH